MHAALLRSVWDNCNHKRPRVQPAARLRVHVLLWAGAIARLHTYLLDHDFTCVRACMCMTRICSTMEVPFPTAAGAAVACTTLSVDKELTASTSKSLQVDGCVLRAQLTASEPRHLRSSLATFLDMLLLTMETMDQFSIEPT